MPLIARARSARAALSFFLIATLSASRAHADDKQVCVRAVERAQNERLDGKLRAAREDFVTCARAACPDAIRVDCTRWISEVEASLPTVVIRAVWPDGRDVAGLTVLLDGQPHPDAAAGRAVSLDPGPHTFRFGAPGAAAVETQNVIRESEKNRVVQVTLPPIEPAATTHVSTNPPAPLPVMGSDPASPTRRPVPTAAFVVGGFALVGFAGFAYAGLSGTGELQHLRSTCAPSCDPSRVDSARREILVADIIGIAAFVAAGVATWLFVTRPAVPLDANAR